MSSAFFIACVGALRAFGAPAPFTFGVRHQESFVSTVKFLCSLSLLLLALIPNAGLASDGLSPAQLAENVEKYRSDAISALENLRSHVGASESNRLALWESNKQQTGSERCEGYGLLLRQSAAKRIFDADFVMISETSSADTDPPTERQRFAAAIIYRGAKRDLEQAIDLVDACFSSGEPFKSGG